MVNLLLAIKRIRAPYLHSRELGQRDRPWFTTADRYSLQLSMARALFPEREPLRRVPRAPHRLGSTSPFTSACWPSEYTPKLSGGELTATRWRPRDIGRVASNLQGLLAMMYPAVPPGLTRCVAHGIAGDALPESCPRSPCAGLGSNSAQAYAFLRTDKARL
jgi:hypothetical protein